MPKQDTYCLNTLRAQLLDHPVYAEVASIEDLRAIHGRSCLRRLGFHVAPEAASARPDVHQSAVVPGGQRTGRPPDQRHRDRRGDGCRSGWLLCQPPRSLPPRHGGRRRQHPPIRHVPLAGAGRYFGRSGYGADRCAASCASLCRAYDERWPGRGRRKRSWRHSFTAARTSSRRCSAGFKRRSLAQGRTTILCVISSTTSIGTSSSMATVTDQWGGSCSKVWSRTRRRGTNVLCTLHATASKPGLTFGMAH